MHIFICTSVLYIITHMFHFCIQFMNHIGALHPNTPQIRSRYKGMVLLTNYHLKYSHLPAAKSIARASLND